MVVEAEYENLFFCDNFFSKASKQTNNRSTIIIRYTQGNIV